MNGRSLLTRPKARLAILLLVLVSIPFALSFMDARLDHDLERFFPRDDPEFAYYEEYSKRFGNDNDFLLIALTNEPSVFKQDFLQRVDSLANDVAGHPQFVSLISPTQLDEPRFTPAGVFQIPWLRLQSDTLLPLDSARIWNDGQLLGQLFSESGRTLMLVGQTEAGLNKDESDELLAFIESRIAELGLDAKLAGRIFGQQRYVQKMQYEVVVFFAASATLLLIFLALAFRSLVGVVVPVVVVATTVLWQIGLMTMLDRPLSILTMLLPTILFVVGMSDVVHILERYIEALRNGRSKVDALLLTYKEVGLATFLTSLTTGIGFLTLWTSSIEPIQEFGTFTAVGVALAYVLSFTLLPSVLLLIKTTPGGRQDHAKVWDRWLRHAFGWVLANQRSILLGSVVLTALAIVLAMQVKVDNSLLEDWSDEDPDKQSFFFFEQEFGGVRPFDMEVITKGDAQVWDHEVLLEIAKLQSYLQDSYGISNIYSPVTVMQALNKASNNGAKEFQRLPSSAVVTKKLTSRLRNFGGDNVRSIATENGTRARLSGRMVDEGGHIHMQKNVALEAFIDKNINGELVEFHQTGMAFLIDRNNARLSQQMLLGLSIAFLLISLIMGWLFRDWRMVLIALVPNVIPLIFIAGVMGATGIDLKVSTAIIFTIAFGIAVDDTIHMLGKLHIELKKGRSLLYALKRSFLSVGKAILVTSLMLGAGFISLIFSSFASVYYMGLLVSITLLVAVLADLLLLPVLVLWVMGRRTSRSTD